MACDQNEQNVPNRVSKRTAFGESSKVREQNGHFNQHDDDEIGQIDHERILQSQTLRQRGSSDKQLSSTYMSEILINPPSIVHVPSMFARSHPNHWTSLPSDFESTGHCSRPSHDLRQTHCLYCRRSRQYFPANPTSAYCVRDEGGARPRCICMYLGR